MASALSKKQYNVTVLEWERSCDHKSSSNRADFNVCRMKLQAPFGSRLIFKLPIWWLYIIFYLISHDFYIIQPQNLDNLLPVYFLSLIRMRKVKIIYDIADFYSDAYVPTHLVLIRKIVAKLERLITRTVDSVILVDESRLEQAKLQTTSFQIIYNSPPDEYSNLVAKFARKTTSDSDSTFAMLYAGILTQDRGLKSLIATIPKINDVSLTIAGFGSMEREIYRLVEKKANVKFLGRISYSEVLELTYLCDCVIALYDPFFPNNAFSSPNKLFEAMMCGKPIIVSDGTTMAKIVDQENCGIIIDYNDSRALESVVNTLKSNKNLSISLGRNARTAYLRKFNWDLMEEKITTLYDSISFPQRTF